MLGGQVAKRYAKALIQIAEAHGNETALMRDLEQFCRLFEASGELRAVLSNPSLETERRDGVLTAVLDKIGGITQHGRNLLRLLLQNGRIDAVDAVRTEFVRLLDQKAGRVRAVVTTAVNLDPMARTKLQRALESLFDKKVVLDPKVDPSVIGGVVAQVGHVVFDGSIRAQFERLKAHLAPGS